MNPWLTRLGWIFALVAMILPALPAAAQPRDVVGWWRGELDHGGEKADFYLHLQGGERTRARFSVPLARMHDGDMGPYQLSGSELRFPGIGWSLNLAENGRVLEGILPAALVPYYRLPVRLERVSAPPPPPSEIVASGEAPAPAWRASVGAEIWAGLVHDARRRLLFVAGDDGRVTALRAANGERAWSVDLGAPIRATPTLDGNSLYVATDSALVAMNARNGAIRWRAQFGAPLAARLPATDPNSQYDHYSGSAVVARDLVLAPGRDGCIHALRKSRGRPAWRQCVGALVTGTPAVAGGKLFFGAFDGQAYALSLADGSIGWRYDTHGPIPRDAVVAGDNVLFGSRSYDLVALDRETGRPAWTRYFWFSWIDSPPTLVDDTVYIGSSDLLAVQALDAATGSRRWSATVPGWSWARPAVADRNVYAAVIGNSAYFQPRAPALAAIDRGSGALRWMFRPQGTPPAGLSGFASAPVVVGDRIFAADLAGNVYAFDDR